jgi:hypothetical protein
MPVRKLDLDSMRWDLPPPLDAVSHHVHHLLSRRAFMGSMAAVAGATVGAGLLPGNVLASTGSSAPKPTTSHVTINGVTFSLAFFGAGIDPSSITDFNGLVGVAAVQGTGTAHNPDGTTETLLFDTDMRFMSGVYVGVDGAVHKGAFGFV